MRVIGIVGSYRRGGVVDTLVGEVLAGAAEAGAVTERVFLLDEPIEFCRNCRACMQVPGEARGACVVHDGMSGLLDRIEAADAIVLGSPMNFGTVTAVMKLFIERLGCFAYWPWGRPAPIFRKAMCTKRGAVVGSSAMPAFMARALTGMVGIMKKALRAMGARCTGVLFVGMAAGHPSPELSARSLARARALGRRLASV